MRAAPRPWMAYPPARSAPLAAGHVPGEEALVELPELDRGAGRSTLGLPRSDQADPADHRVGAPGEGLERRPGLHRIARLVDRSAPRSPRPCRRPARWPRALEGPPSAPCGARSRPPPPRDRPRPSPRRRAPRSRTRRPAAQGSPAAAASERPGSARASGGTYAEPALTRGLGRTAPPHGTPIQARPIRGPCSDPPRSRSRRESSRAKPPAGWWHRSPGAPR